MTHAKLSTLNLSNALATDEEATTIINSLRHNGSVKYLIVHQCELGAGAQAALTETLKINATLTKIKGLRPELAGVANKYLWLNQLCSGNVKATKAELATVLETCVTLGKITAIAPVIQKHTEFKKSLKFHDSNGVLIHHLLLLHDNPNQGAVTALFRTHFEVDDPLSGLISSTGYT